MEEEEEEQEREQEEGGEEVEGTMTMTMTMTMRTMQVFHRLFELPRDLYLKVLFRLPLKYVITLRCASKVLLHLTNNPSFIASYFLQSKANPNLLLNFNFIDTVPRPSSLLLLSPPPPPLDSSSSSSSTPPIDVTNLWRFHIVIKGSNFIYSAGKYNHHGLIPFRCPEHKYLVSSSSNGLICFAGSNSLEIYNILSGVNYLIESNMIDPFMKSLTYSKYVFGFDPASNDYKIVSFHRQPRWKMFSFRTNSWKPLVVNRPSSASTIWSNSENGSTICINGVIYWPLHPRDLEDEEGIGFASFDLHQEKLVGIKPPPPDGILPEVQYSDLQLLSFRGCPCFAYIKREEKVGRRRRTTTTTKSRKGSAAAAAETSHSGAGAGGAGAGCGFQVELFILKNNGGGCEGDDNAEENVHWIRESIVTPFCLPQEVQLLSLYDQIFLTWFEAKHLQLYNLHTNCFFKLPRSPPNVYYPKVSRSKTKHNPTYVENLRFDFSLI